MIIMDLGSGDRFLHPHATNSDEFLLTDILELGPSAFRTAIRMRTGEACKFHPAAEIFPTLRLKED